MFLAYRYDIPIWLYYPQISNLIWKLQLKNSFKYYTCGQNGSTMGQLQLDKNLDISVYHFRSLNTLLKMAKETFTIIFNRVICTRMNLGLEFVQIAQKWRWTRKDRVFSGAL